MTAIKETETLGTSMLLNILVNIIAINLCSHFLYLFEYFNQSTVKLSKNNTSQTINWLHMCFAHVNNVV